MGAKGLKKYYRIIPIKKKQGNGICLSTHQQMSFSVIIEMVLS